MAIPTAPTLSTITDEALNRAGYSTPTSAQLTSAQDQWMEEIKNDIWKLEKRLLNLQTTAIAILTKGQSRYSNPTDYSNDLTMIIMDGSTTGTAQSGTASTIKLVSTDSSAENDVLGKEIVVTGGTGAASISQITAFNTTTKVATVKPDFDTAPDSTSTYKIITKYFPLERLPIWELDNSSNPTQLVRPNSFHIMGDADNTEFILDSAPDVSYPAKQRYYADLMEIDLAGTLMATLYKKWRNVWIKGIIWKSFKLDLDDREKEARAEYVAELGALIADQKVGAEYESEVGESQLTIIR